MQLDSPISMIPDSLLTFSLLYNLTSFFFSLVAPQCMLLPLRTPLATEFIPCGLAIRFHLFPPHLHWPAVQRVENDQHY